MSFFELSFWSQVIFVCAIIGGISLAVIEVALAFWEEKDRKED